MITTLQGQENGVVMDKIPERSKIVFRLFKNRKRFSNQAGNRCRIVPLKHSMRFVLPFHFLFPPHDVRWRGKCSICHLGIGVTDRALSVPRWPGIPKTWCSFFCREPTYLQDLTDVNIYSQSYLWLIVVVVNNRPDSQPSVFLFGYIHLI